MNYVIETVLPNPSINIFIIKFCIHYLVCGAKQSIARSRGGGGGGDLPYQLIQLCEEVNLSHSFAWLAVDVRSSAALSVRPPQLIMK